jgi:hypothetical protein
VTNRLLSGWRSNQIAQIPSLKQGDSVLAEIHWIASYGVVLAEEVPFPPSATVTLAIGLVGEPPTSGTYTITYDGDTTAALAYNASLVAVEAALNGLASIIADGGVDVEGDEGTKRIVWRTVGARTETITINVDSLSPTSQYGVTVYRNGDASHTHILLVSISQAPVAVCTTFEPSPQPVITTELVLSDTWRLTIYPYPKSGSFQISFTAGFETITAAALAFDSTANNIQLALNAMLASTSSQFVVNEVGQYTWDIVCPTSIITLGDVETSIGSISATSALVGFSSILGTVDLNTANLEEFLSGYGERDAIIEVQVDIGGNVQTIAHSDITLINDLISADMFNIIERTDVMPLDSVVRYDTSQALTSPQKETARTNIAAAGMGDVATLQTSVDVLSGELSALSYSIITVTQKEAIDGADTPSSSNVFITDSVLTTVSTDLSDALTAGLATKAALVHTHVSTDITDSTSAGRSMFTSATAASQRTLLGLGSMALASDLDYMDQETQFLTFVTLGGSPVLTGQPVLSATGIKFHDGTIQTTAAIDSAFFAPINSPHFTGLPWLGISGIKFYDGTIQTTASAGGGGSYLPLTDGGTVTQTSTGATTVIDGYSIVSTFAGYTARAELNPIATGVYNTGTSASALLTPTAGLVLVGGGMGVTFADGTIQTTAATGGGGPYLEPANNLSDVSSVGTSRDNLGLGVTDIVSFDGVATEQGISLDGSTAINTATSYLDRYTLRLGTGFVASGSDLFGAPALVSITSYPKTINIGFAPFGGGIGVWIQEYGVKGHGISETGFVFEDDTELTTRPINGSQDKPGGTTYTKEVKVQDVDGTWYWVSARLA